MLDLLFVYGSLLSTIGHAKGAELRRCGHLVGPASLQARLYKVSWYPGAVSSADVEDRVRGELYRLADPVAALAWLDAYEGISPGSTRAGSDDEYARIALPVTGPDGQPVQAWVYVYRRATIDLPRIATGVWTG